MNSLGQNVQLLQEETIDGKTIIIVDHAKHVFKMVSRKRLVQAFGKTKVVKEVAEPFEGGYAYTYKYKGLEVSFSARFCENTEVKGPEYIFYLNGKAYTVGDRIEKLKRNFPVL